jgi:ankyrin repeat protein
MKKTLIFCTLITMSALAMKRPRPEEAEIYPTKKQKTDISLKQLETAVKNKDIDVVKALLAQGLMLDLANKESAYILKIAMLYEDPTILTLLLDRTKNINALDSGSFLNSIINNAPVGSILLLLNKGADPNAAVDRFAKTPLNTVITSQEVQQRQERVQALLDAGARIRRSHIELAEQEGLPAIAQQLREGTRAAARKALEHSEEPDTLYSNLTRKVVLPKEITAEIIRWSGIDY